jgi:hypothetical protein
MNFVDRGGSRVSRTRKKEHLRTRRYNRVLLRTDEGREAYI